MWHFQSESSRHITFDVIKPRFLKIHIITSHHTDFQNGKNITYKSHNFTIFLLYLYSLPLIRHWSARISVLYDYDDKNWWRSMLTILFFFKNEWISEIFKNRVMKYYENPITSHHIIRDVMWITCDFGFVTSYCTTLLFSSKDLDDQGLIQRTWSNRRC